jgi:MFS family permease
MEQDESAATPPQAQANREGPSGKTRRNVLWLGFVSFSTDISSEMSYPIVPLFLTTTLGAPVAVLGVIEGLAEGTASLLKAASGWYSDRVGARKPLVLGGYGLSTVGKVLLGTAFVWPQVLVARVVDRLGKGVRTAPRDALIADSTPPERFGRAFGLHRAMDTAGAVAGPLLALILIAVTNENLRVILLLALAPAAVGIALIGLVGERRAAPRPDVGLVGGFAGAGRRYWHFMAVSLLFGVGNSSDAFIILRAQDLGLGVTLVVLAYVVYNCVYAGLSVPTGYISDVLGRRGVIFAGLVLFSGVYFGFAAAGHAAAVWFLFAAYGVYMAMTEGVGRAFVADLVEPERRATLLGLYHSGIGAAAVLSSVLAGVLWQVVGPPAPFLVGGATAATAAVLLVAVPSGRLAEQA